MQLIFYNLYLDEIGRRVSEGRREARDVFDVYMLSNKIKPLYIFLQGVSKQLQRGMIHWYQTFSRQELKLSLQTLFRLCKVLGIKKIETYSITRGDTV